MALVAAGAHVGGMLTGGLSRSDVERQEALIGGIAREVFERIAARSRDAHHPPDGRVAWRFEPHVAEAVLEEMLSGRGFRAIYSRQRIDAWRAQNRCPQNDRLCTEAIWLVQTMLLGPRQDMDDIAEAVRKVQATAAELVKTSVAR